MSYDPFARGPYPVGVESHTWVDTSRARTLPVEVWYPASEDFRGQDLDEATCDTFIADWAATLDPEEAPIAIQHAVRDATRAVLDDMPLVLLIHGWAGFRREATFLGTHLASHGYVVVSPDVPGSTWADVDGFLTASGPGASPGLLRDHASGIAADRVQDIPFLISTAVDVLPGVRPTGVGVMGASFGGFSSAIAPSADERVAAVVPMCPANDDAPILAPHRLLAEHLEKPWKSDAAVLMCVGDRDSLLPLYGQFGLLRSLPASNKRLVAMAHADHNHFVDDIETGQEWMGEFVTRVAECFPEGPGNWSYVAESVAPMDRLIPGEQAKAAWRGLALAHFDEHLRGDERAARAMADVDALTGSIAVETTTVECR